MSQPRDLIGTLLNDTYRLERLIGEGGMGAVFEATHQRVHGRFAVKVLAPRFGALSDEAALARFRREVEVTSRLKHPHIVEVTDANRSEGGLLYFVMELLQGEDLGVCLKREGALHPVLASIILEQLASALEAAHREGVVHRDLKPSNIYLCQRPESEGPRVKVLDFSLSKVIGASMGPTAEVVVLGTPSYMAPEQAQGRSADVTPRTDVYAAGAILYRMVTGRPPFSSPLLEDLLDAIISTDPTAPRLSSPDLSADAEAVILKALRKLPEDRYSSMLSLSEAFAVAVAGDPFVDRPTGRWRAGAAVPSLKPHPPPAGQIDDLKTPPLERVAAGVVEEPSGGAVRSDESLPSVLAPEVEDAPTIPALDPLAARVQPVLPSMRPADVHDGRPLPRLREGEAPGTDPDGGPTDPVLEPAGPAPRAGEIDSSVRSEAAWAHGPGEASVLVDPTAEVTPGREGSRRGTWLLTLTLVLAAGAGAWLYYSRSPSYLNESVADADPEEVAAGPDGDAGLADGPVSTDVAPEAPSERSAEESHRRLWLSSRPAGARVYLGGRLLGKTPLRGVKVPTERVELRVRRRGHRVRTVPLGAGRRPIRFGVVGLRRLRRAKAAPAPGRLGRLAVVARYSGKAVPADIFLDGTKVGQSFLYRRDVTPGAHRIQARWRGLKSAVRSVQVRARRETRVVLVLER